MFLCLICKIAIIIAEPKSKVILRNKLDFTWYKRSWTALTLAYGNRPKLFLFLTSVMKRDWNICSINNCCTWKDIFEHFMNTKVLYEHKLFLILCKITLESGSIEKMYLMRKKKWIFTMWLAKVKKPFPKDHTHVHSLKKHYQWG